MRDVNLDGLRANTLRPRSGIGKDREMPGAVKVSHRVGLVRWRITLANRRSVV